MNRIVFAGIFCLISSLSLAQTSIGLRGGFGNSSITYQPAPSSRRIDVPGISAPTFAFVIEHFSAKNAGVELNIQYLSLGFLQENKNNPEQINETQFEYLKIPILSSFYLGRKGRFLIKAGPHFGYMLSANDISRPYSGATPAELPTYGEPADSPNKFQYGLTGGVGIAKLFGKSTLAAEARFGFDFSKPEKQNRIFDMNSTNLEFTLSYLFRVREMRE
jgi:hypothetical protein